MASIPFKIMLYVFIGSVPVKGGVPVKQKKSKKKSFSRKKREITGQKLKHQNAERPIISTDIMPLIQNDFWRHVFRGAAKGPRFPTGLLRSKTPFNEICKAEH